MRQDIPHDKCQYNRFLKRATFLYCLYFSRERKSFVAGKFLHAYFQDFTWQWILSPCLMRGKNDHSELQTVSMKSKHMHFVVNHPREEDTPSFILLVTSRHRYLHYGIRYSKVFYKSLHSLFGLKKRPKTI